MKKIVINGRYITQPITGVQRYAHELTLAIDVLLDNYPDVNVEILSPRSTRINLRLRNIKHRQIGLLHGYAWEQFELPLYTLGCTLFCPGNIAPLLSLIFNKNVIVTVHDLSFLYFPHAYSFLFRLLYFILTPFVFRFSSQVITVSESEKTQIVKRFPYASNRITAIQNGGINQQLNIVNTLPQHACDGEYVLYVGSLSKRKNIDNMLLVAEKIVSVREVKFIFIGSIGSSLVKTKFLLDSKYTKNILFLGQINDPHQLIQYYKSATCFFFPSFYEASPFPPIEAMSCGCPVLVSNVPSLIERCDDAAIYCDPNNIDDMKRSLLQLIDDKLLQASLRRKGYLQAQKYSWDNCASKTFALLQKQ